MWAFARYRRGHGRVRELTSVRTAFGGLHGVWRIRAPFGGISAPEGRCVRELRKNVIQMYVTGMRNM